MYTKKTYELSFSAGALMSDSFRSVVENCIDFNNLKAELNNIHYSVIPANAESSQKRYLLEIKKRIVNVPSNLLNKYLLTDLHNQKVIEFFAVCNTYSIIREFMLEVIRNKWLNLDFELENYDFKTFLIKKLSYTENLEQLTELTIDKLTQVTLKMLRELGMFNGEMFKKIEVKSDLLEIIFDAGNEWFLDVMLLTDNEKLELKK